MLSAKANRDNKDNRDKDKDKDSRIFKEKEMFCGMLEIGEVDR